MKMILFGAIGNHIVEGTQDTLEDRLIVLTPTRTSASLNVNFLTISL